MFEDWPLIEHVSSKYTWDDILIYLWPISTKMCLGSCELWLLQTGSREEFKLIRGTIFTCLFVWQKHYKVLSLTFFFTHYQNLVATVQFCWSKILIPSTVFFFFNNRVTFSASKPQQSAKKLHLKPNQVLIQSAMWNEQLVRLTYKPFLSYMIRQFTRKTTAFDLGWSQWEERYFHMMRQGDKEKSSLQIWQI